MTSGTPIITVGDPRRLEIVVDLLSTDAVKVKPGAAIFLENWGGEAAIRARVRTVEPSAFTKSQRLESKSSAPTSWLTSWTRRGLSAMVTESK